MNSSFFASYAFDMLSDDLLRPVPCHFHILAQNVKTERNLCKLNCFEMRNVSAIRQHVKCI